MRPSVRERQLDGAAPVRRPDRSRVARRRTLACFAVLVVLGAIAVAPRPARSHGWWLGYRLAWHQDGVVRGSAEPGWSVVSDLGFHVRVTRGYLVSYGMEFVECEGDPAGAGPRSAASRAGALAALLGPSPAHAGHGSADPNPARLGTTFVESLTEAGTIDVGYVEAPAYRYCSLHYLVAGARRGAVGLPDDVDMLGASLHVEGVYRAPSGQIEAPFTIRTSAANGVLGALRGSLARFGPAGVVEVDGSIESARATISRDLSTMFDGVDFVALSDRQASWRVLNNLIAATEIVVERIPAGQTEP